MRILPARTISQLLCSNTIEYYSLYWNTEIITRTIIFYLLKETLTGTKYRKSRIKQQHEEMMTQKMLVISSSFSLDKS